MEELIKLIKDYRSTKNKRAYLMILLEKSKKNELPIYSLLQLLNSISSESTAIISSEGWIEKDVDLQQQIKIIEIENVALKKEKTDFANNKKDNLYFKGSMLVISFIVIGLFLFYYVLPNSKLKGEEEMWKNALIENTMASYNNFMIQYPKSKYYEKAQKQNRIIKEKIEKTNPLMESSTISAIKNGKKKSPTDNSKIKQEYKEIEIKDFAEELYIANDYYHNAKINYNKKDYKSALSLIDSALKYYPNNNQYIKFKSDLMNQQFVQNGNSFNEKGSSKNSQIVFHIQDTDGWSNMRISPGGEIIRKIYPDEKFIILETQDKYKYIEFLDGEKGYVHESRVFPIK